MKRASLAGCRVVVTRPAAQAQRLLRALSELGAVPIPLALIQICEPADDGAALRAAGGRLHDFEWVVVTSPNAAERIAPWVARATAPRPRIAVVGRATQHKLDCVADLVAPQQYAQGLLDAFPDGAGEILLLQPQGAASDSVLAAGLARKGWKVYAVDAYRTEFVELTEAERALAQQADAVLFASGSAVRSWVHTFGHQTPPVTIAIGPATFQEMSKFGLMISGTATDYSEYGLISALIAHMSTL